MRIVREISWFSRRFFVLIVIGASLVGYYRPGAVGWVGTSIGAGILGKINGVIIGLGIIMFGMGMTLDLDEISVALVHPGRILIGVLFQFGLMPLVALAIVFLVDLSIPAALGILLVGCCPGGTASNVMAYLADADVSLSIAVTVAGTLLAVVLTPWFFWFYSEWVLGVYVGEPINVPIYLLARTIAVVVGPVLLGLAFKASVDFSDEEEYVNQIFSLLSILVIALIVSYVVSNVDPDRFVRGLTGLSLPVLLHNGLGLGTGFLGAWILGMPQNSVRTLSLEVGMQNSGLAMALAGVLQTQLASSNVFTASELALLGVPAVLFSVWHNITGPFLASIWSRNP